MGADKSALGAMNRPLRGLRVAGLIWESSLSAPGCGREKLLTYPCVYGTLVLL
jgi:hypothetical protein